MAPTNREIDKNKNNVIIAVLKPHIQGFKCRKLLVVFIVLAGRDNAAHLFEQCSRYFRNVLAQLHVFPQSHVEITVVLLIACHNNCLGSMIFKESRRDWNISACGPFNISSRVTRFCLLTQADQSSMLEVWSELSGVTPEIVISAVVEAD